MSSSFRATGSALRRSWSPSDPQPHGRRPPTVPGHLWRIRRRAWTRLDSFTQTTSGAAQPRSTTSWTSLMPMTDRRRPISATQPAPDCLGCGPLLQGLRWLPRLRSSLRLARSQYCRNLEVRPASAHHASPRWPSVMRARSRRRPYHPTACSSEREQHDAARPVRKQPLLGAERTYRGRIATRPAPLRRHATFPSFPAGPAPQPPSAET